MAGPTNFERTPEVASLSPVVEGINAVRTPSITVLATIDLTVAAPYVRVPEQVTLVPETEAGVIRTPELVVLVAYGEGARENLTQRAWGFVLDGHTFYVLHLGELGTYVCDLSTGLWAQFQTQGMTQWNAEVGLMWQGMIIAGDNQNPTLWDFDPDGQLDDDYKQVIHESVGIYPVRTRNFVSFDLLAITVSHSNPNASSPASTIALSYSDNDGKTFAVADPIFTIISDSEPQDIQWSSLGSANQPGRIFKITDVGGMVRLSSADLTVRGSKRNNEPTEGS